VFLHLCGSLHYMYFAVGLFLATVLVAVGVSLMTPSPPPEQLRGTTVWTKEGLEHKEKVGRGLDYEVHTRFNRPMPSLLKYAAPGSDACSILEISYYRPLPSLRKSAQPTQV
jgi:hypothetical protein